MVTINSAESNRAVVRYIPEVTWGTTPASGKVRTARLLKSGIIASKEAVQSNELRADRMVPNIIEVSAGTAGPIETELSCFSNDDFFQQFLLGAWTLPMLGVLVKGASVDVTGANTVTLTGADWTGWLADNQWVKLEGFLNPENNRYVRINGTPSFSAGNTVVTVDETLVVEAGSAFSKFLDASDVILISTTTAITAGNTINGGGANSFAGLTLKVGQKIYIEGLGKETGTLTCDAANPTEGDTFVISDGVNSLTFEIRTNAALVALGNIHVPLSDTEATLAANIKAAVNGQFLKEAFRVSATAAAAVVTLRNGRGTGGSIAESSTGLTAANFSGGDATKFGFRTIASLPNDDTIVVAETLTADANGGGLTVVVKGSHVRNPGTIGEITKQSISAETSFTDVNKNMLHDGLRVGTFELSVAPGEIVTCNFNFTGRRTQPLPGSTQLGAGPYVVLDSNATQPLNATANVGQLLKDGVALTTAVMSINLSGDASLREQRAIGEKFPAGIGYGRFSLTGSLTAYFQNFDQYNAFINHTTASLSFGFEDADHNRLFFTVPALKFTANPVQPEGIDTDVKEPIEFMAQRDPVLNTMLMLDRFSSTYPQAIA